MWVGEGVRSLQGSTYTEGVCIFLRALSTESTRHLQQRLAEVLSKNPCVALGVQMKVKYKTFFKCFIVLKDKRLSSKR